MPAADVVSGHGDHEDDEELTAAAPDAAQLYRTLVLLGGGADGSVPLTVARIVQAHGASSLLQVVRQFAPLFLSGDEETRTLYERAMASGESDSTVLTALFERFKPLLEQASTPSNIFDADEEAGAAALPVAAADTADGADGGHDEGDEDGFHDAENDGQAFRCHELVYDGDIEGLRTYIVNFPSEIHMLDPRGHTPAHIAVQRHSLAALELLLEAGYDINVQSAAGWTVLEDAVAIGDVPMVRTLLAASHEAQMRMWKIKKPIMLQAMADMPDFKMKLSWEFGSPVFSGLVKQLAPYDEYSIWKVGTKLRVDASIVGFEGTKWVRGSVSLRFDGSAKEGELCIVNHDEKKVFVKEAGMLSNGREASSLDNEAELLLGTEIVQVSVKTANTVFEPVKLRLRDGYKSETVGKWDTVVYAAASDLEIERKQKTGKVRELPATYAEYLSQVEPEGAAVKRGRRGGRRRQQTEEEEVQIIKKKATVCPQLSRQRPCLREIGTFLRLCLAPALSPSRCLQGRANMVTGFPISTEQLVKLLEMVAPLNKEIAKARSFLEEKVPEGLFPVKVCSISHCHPVCLLFCLRLTMRAMPSRLPPAVQDPGRHVRPPADRLSLVRARQPRRPLVVGDPGSLREEVDDRAARSAR